MQAMAFTRSNATVPAVMTVKVVGEGADEETIVVTVVATKVEVGVAEDAAEVTTRRGVDHDLRRLRKSITT